MSPRFEVEFIFIIFPLSFQLWAKIFLIACENKWSVKKEMMLNQLEVGEKNVLGVILKLKLVSFDWSKLFSMIRINKVLEQFWKFFCNLSHFLDLAEKRKKRGKKIKIKFQKRFWQKMILLSQKNNFFHRQKKTW